MRMIEELIKRYPRIMGMVLGIGLHPILTALLVQR
jgi:hypothetical protein